MHKSQWAWYLFGAFLALGWKLARYLYHGQNMLPRRSYRECLTEWFFEASQENAVSWATTIGVVWALGTIYIERIVNIDALSNIPVSSCFSFLLGSLLEVIAPNLVKRVAGFVSGGQT